MNQKIEYGSSLTATANDIAFALETMKQAGFVIRQPVGVDLREVACQVLGIDGDDDVEQLVSNLAMAIDQASISMPAPDHPADVDMKAIIDQAKEVHVVIPAGLSASDTAKLVRIATPEVANAVAGQLVVDAMRPVLDNAKFEGEAIMRDALPPGKA